eukprot:m.28091 g.28091  ORF g.28091 m.28091 type:complete len:395 (-) comp15861_c0_seq1:367-1551(-)
MNAFIDLTGEDQLQELVSYTATLLVDEDPNFAATCQTKIANNQATDVLSDIIGHSKKYYAGPKDIGSILNSVARLLCMFKPEETNAWVKMFAAALADVEIEGHTAIRMKILGNLFNNLETSSPARFDAYIALLELAGKSGTVSVVEGTFSKLDRWIAEWQITVEQQRTLYATLHRITEQSKYSKRSTAFLTKLLDCCDGEDADSLKASKAYATKLIALSLSDADLFDMEPILALKSVQRLKSEKCLELLSLFQAADLKVYQQWVSANPTVLTDLGLDADDMLRKVRLLRLAFICAESASVGYTEIATALAIEEDDVEMWIIDVIGANLVEAKVDQVNKKIYVSRSNCTKFGQAEWEGLKTRLTTWQKNLAQCKRVMTTVKLQIDEASKQARIGR